MNRNTAAPSALTTVETRLTEAHGIVRNMERRLGVDADGRRLLERAQGWCILVGFYLASLDDAWGSAVPAEELARVGSHAAERYLSAVGGALCGVLRAPGAATDSERSAAVHDLRDALMRILDALLNPGRATPTASLAFG